MMRLALSALLCFYMAHAPAGHEPAALSETKAKLQIEELEKRSLAAEDDPEALQVILAQDCVLVTPSGVIGKKERIAQVKTKGTAAQNATRRFDDLRVRIYGNIGIANGMIAATEARTNVTRKWLFTDVWAYRDGRWQAINTQRTPVQP